MTFFISKEHSLNNDLHGHRPSQLSNDLPHAADALERRAAAVLGAVGERRRGLDVGLEARCEV